MIKVLRLLLGVAFIVYVFYFFTNIAKAKKNGEIKKEAAWKPLVTGFITDFLDTLGIGSFAPSMFLFKALKQNIPDKNIPGTLNVAHSLPTLLEATLFIGAVKVDPATLIILIASAVVGSYIGAGIISKMEEKKLQFVMGIALLVSAAFFLASVIGIMPIGGNALGLSGMKLIVAAILFFILGALMTAGIGLYAPAMVVVFSMGMDPAAAFPIMMGSCALLMPVASIKFIKEDTYAKENALLISISGLLGVTVAYNFFKGLDVEKLKILVIMVVSATGVMMLKSAFKKVDKQNAMDEIYKEQAREFPF